MKVIFTALFVCFALLSFGQQPLKKPHYNFFLKNNGTVVDDLDSADYVRFVFEPDEGSALYDVDEYTKKGELRFTGKSLKINPLILTGQAVWYYLNGNRKTALTYIQNYAHGEVSQFFPNGKLYLFKKLYFKDSTKIKKPDFFALSTQDSVIISAFDTAGKATVENGNGYIKRYNNNFDQVTEEGAIKNGKPDGTWKGKDISHKITFTEKYEGGKLVSATAIDSLGASTNYSTRFTRPEYPGGPQALGKFLSKNIRYPERARQQYKHGTVMLKIALPADGKVKDIKVINSVEASIDEEALRVARQMPDWVPGTAYGKPATYFYTLPITFSLGY